MKRFCMILAAAAIIPAAAMAQKRIAAAVEQLRRSQYTEISVNKETDIDADGKECVYEVYAYEIPKNAGKFKQLVDAFDSDQADAYSVMKRLQGVSGDTQSIGYGRGSRKSVSFGTYKDRNYYLLLFNDPKDTLRRTCYEMTWYEAKKQKKQEMWQVYITHIYSINPKRAGRTSSTTTTTTTTIMPGGGPSTSTTVASDGTIIRYDRNTGNSVVYRPQKNSTEKGSVQINDATDFLSRFNDLRVEYVRAIEFAGKEQAFYAQMIMKPVKELLSLCRNYNRLLNSNEKVSCSNTLGDMANRTRDRGVQEMLTLAQKYLRE